MSPLDKEIVRRKLAVVIENIRALDLIKRMTKRGIYSRPLQEEGDGKATAGIDRGSYRHQYPYYRSNRQPGA